MGAADDEQRVKEEAAELVAYGSHLITELEMLFDDLHFIAQGITQCIHIRLNQEGTIRGQYQCHVAER